MSVFFSLLMIAAYAMAVYSVYEGEWRHAFAFILASLLAEWIRNAAKKAENEKKASGDE